MPLVNFKIKFRNFQKNTKMKKLFILFGIIALGGCSLKDNKSDAYGNFEAVETIIAPEVGGKILFFNAEEGSTIEAGKLVALIDTADLQLKKEQLMEQKRSIASRSSNVFSQVDVQNQQKANLMVDKVRLQKLLKEGAATQKQLDDIDGNIRLVDKQIGATNSQNASVLSEMAVVQKQIEQVNESISKCYIINPITGTVLERYAEPFEMITQGKALYKIADISSLYLKVYISGSQLPLIKLGQKVQVMVDGSDKSLVKHEGEITWIAPSAEFTPKIIQTKEERVNLVYAVKIKTKNDGSLKIGMPGEVVFK